MSQPLNIPAREAWVRGLPRVASHPASHPAASLTLHLPNSCDLQSPASVTGDSGLDHYSRALPALAPLSNTCVSRELPCTPSPEFLSGMDQDCLLSNREASNPQQM